MPEPGYVAVFLELVRVHLPSLTSLTLEFHVRGLEWRHSTSLWDVLARFSYLQKLQIHFGIPEIQPPPVGTQMWPGISYLYGHYADLQLNSLRALSSLTSLSSLTVTALNIATPQKYTFLSCLTALTHLQLPLVRSEGNDWDDSDNELEGDAPQSSRMAPFTSLKELQSLALTGTLTHHLGTVVFHHCQLTAEDCISLAQLTSLTTLQLKFLNGLSSKNLLQQLLSPLQQLQVLHLPKVKPSVALPALAGLVNLRELNVEWGEDPQAGSGRRAMLGLACPSILKLTCEGPVPVEAFPEVRVTTHPQS